ncbi:MAG: type II toxin-antitoxin system RelE/ParE family toxin [Devosia sp.]|nr:type II toxin-antitoxin system RelE/ParE family toxin [Devosia sp.]
MAYRTTFEAEEDIAKIFAAGIAEYGVVQAEAYISELLDVLALIGRQPLLMRLRDEYQPAVRFRVFRGHLVVYRDDDGDAVVVRVLHGRQDVSNELS